MRFELKKMEKANRNTDQPWDKLQKRRERANQSILGKK